ncbi:MULTISPECIES: DUF6458 family protein [Micromonospora]|uniref:DUF6458 domain-containing protein n=1 Tax=Micromonospora yangpuensis TaxID=683228 RepID=A0A1C6TXE2_9ACTN|nr:DUF6458 family protein [Micromonospora yangpuensis]GGM01973.1 hypothetical protein GCM10012279_19590 [Micromonospora yangpuensis]SCL46424.1 hypothetical protein GA0070617_0262 [Micromonospora yangpuensis]
MGIGGSIFLIAVGAIFAFAVEANLGWLNLSVVGWVLMLAGLAGLITTLYFWNSRRRPVVAAPVAENRVVTERAVPVREQVVREHREVRGPGYPV